jgi:hypothetical protein
MRNHYRKADGNPHPERMIPPQVSVNEQILKRIAGRSAAKPEAQR